VFVAVVTTPYVKSSHTPPGQVVMGGDEESTLIPEDVATIVVESHMPWSQGLVDVPAWPFFPVLPCSGNGSSLIHWMITAEVAGILADTDSRPAPGELAVRYVETLLSHLEESWERCWGTIRDDLAPEIARRIIEGGHYFVDSHGAYAGDGMATQQVCSPKLTVGFSQSSYMLKNIPCCCRMEGCRRGVMAAWPRKRRGLRWALSCLTITGRRGAQRSVGGGT
jgi:hypothetical protein